VQIRLALENSAAQNDAPADPGLLDAVETDAELLDVLLARIQSLLLRPSGPRLSQDETLPAPRAGADDSR
jgi:hypothetical protein